VSRQKDIIIKTKNKVNKQTWLLLFKPQLKARCVGQNKRRASEGGNCEISILEPPIL